MCELFGVSSPEKVILNKWLGEFFSHGNSHPDGWGMAFFDLGGVSVEKEPVNSCRSEYLKHRLKSKILSARMMAHIRLATKGGHNYENSHPFTGIDSSGRCWTLAHNGTIFESELLDPLFHVQDGQTDSERILLYIIQQMNLAQTDKDGRSEGDASLSDSERFRIMDRILQEITPENKVNLLVLDGDLFYVHTNYANSLHLRREGSLLLVSTHPLDAHPWDPVPMNTLIAFRNGKRIYTGTTHANEYFDNKEKTRHLLLDYSFL